MLGVWDVGLGVEGLRGWRAGLRDSSWGQGNQPKNRNGVLEAEAVRLACWDKCSFLGGNLFKGRKGQEQQSEYSVNTQSSFSCKRSKRSSFLARRGQSLGWLCVYVGASQN